MKYQRHPRPDAPPLPIARFRAIVESYGGLSQHWPADEREAAQALLAISEEARRMRAAAQALDDLLDKVPAPAASAALAERILAAAPRGPVASREAATPIRSRVVPLRRPTVWRYATASLPLAAAAALMLWMVWPQATPTAVQFAIEDLGRYAAPSDVLLEGMILDLADSVPPMGCGDSGLGCIDGGSDAQLDSHHTDHGRLLA